MRYNQTIILVRSEFMSKKKVAIIFIIIAVGLLVAGGILVFQNYSNKNRIVTSFNDLKASLEETFSSNNNEGSGIKETATGFTKFYINPLLGNSSDGSDIVINNLNNSTLNYEYRIDTEAKKLYFDGSLLFNMQELLGINFYQNENISYIFLRNLFDKYIAVEDNDIFTYLEESANSKEDIDYIYNLMVESIKNNITADDIKVSNEKIDNKDVKKISLELDDKRFEELTNNIIDDIKNDKRANEILGDFISQMETTINENKNTTTKTDDVFINYNIYTNKNNIIRYEVEFGDNTSKATIRYNDEDKKSIELLEDDTVIGSASITKENNNLNVGLTINNENIGTIVISENETSVDLSISDVTDPSTVVQIKYNSQKENTNINSTFTIDMSINGTPINFMNITDTKTITENNANFSNINTTNNINANDLTEEDITAIQNNLMTILYNFMGIAM